PAVAALIPGAALSGICRPGDYRVAIARWSFEALRPMEQLWYGVEPMDVEGVSLSDEEAERFISIVAEAGLDWPAGAGELDLERVAHDLEQGLLVTARERFEEHTERMRAQNEDRADAEIRSLERHLAQQTAKYEEIRQRHLQRRNLGLAKA